ncbi:oxidoreductase [Actinokineospora cianjurensis]|uniref:Putative dehydrogenase n=1 Tax=Actinokineospora cianjurensis TaxID=585224 RepID=A0A421BA96_9PSEU|nr:oxidoreductase [Actinokineospora cianjurensis]RLK61248.1 putative dehydrogenase [Actinokineospora cianjurensis]
MLGTLVVGLGRAGAGLHLPVLRRLGHGGGRPFGRPPITVYDPRRRLGDADLGDVAVAHSPAHAATLVDPDRTVVHLCTGPSARLRPLTELADLGFRRFLVEKPLAGDEVELREVLRLREHGRLDLLPVAQWRSSELTARILGVLAGGRLGRLRSVRFAQSKPRFARTLAGDDHPTAFDVEVPHSLTVALLVAGRGEVVAAGCTDMLLGDAVFPSLGGAWLRLRHADGVLTEIRTDLTAPVRERRVTVELEGGTLVGHYPIGAADEYAQLSVRTKGGKVESVFRDDSLGAFIARAYRHFEGTEPITDEPATGATVVSLLAEAKRVAGLRAPVEVPR